MAVNRNPFKQLQTKFNLPYILSVGFIFACLVIIMGIMVNRKALDPEALANFRFMRELTLLDVWTGGTFPGHFAAYRPVLGSLLRIEYLLFGLNPPAFFTVNLLLLGVVAFLIFEIIYRITGNILPALVAVLFFITDWRSVQTIYVIGEVQITLAAIFGLIALWLIWFRNKRPNPVVIYMLLLLSALSKEFGLAFALAVLIDAFLRKKTNWKKLAGVSIAAVATFIVLRLLMTAAPSIGKEYSSFQNMMKWIVLNISSGFFFTFVNLFRPASDGDLPTLDVLRWSPAESWLITIFQIIPIIIFFILAFRNKEDRSFTIPILFLVLGNSFLFFWRYAFRFHFLGTIGMYLVVGVGINYLYTKWLKLPQMLNTLIIGFMFLSSILLWRADRFHQYLVTHRHWTENGLLCIPTDEYYLQEDFFGYYTVTDQETVRLVMDYYGLPQEYCNCLDPYSVCK
jgi:hypothetical protein